MGFTIGDTVKAVNGPLKGSVGEITSVSGHLAIEVLVAKSPVRSFEGSKTFFRMDQLKVIQKGSRRSASEILSDLEMRIDRLEKSANASQRDFIKKWNRSGNYSDLEKAGLADAYDELYSLTVKEEERGELSSRENKRYVDLYDMLTKNKVEIRFGVNI